MKALTALKKALLFTMISVISFSCSDDDDPIVVQQPETIAELAIATADLSNLVAALQRADLVSTLNGSGQFTVFAPTNAAFSKFLTDNGFASLDDVPTDVLKQVLLNHVISGEVKSGDLTTGYGTTLATEASTDNNLSIYINTNSGVKLNGISDVVTADIDATNGVIHIVDHVIGLPSVVDLALADDTFSILVSALTRSDLTFDYVTTLSTPNGTAPAPFTVFAPTNDAFVNLLSELGVSSLDDIDEPTLKATLDLHAIAGVNVLASALTDNMTVSTLGGDITANVTGGATLTDSNGRVSNIVVTDVQADNGVIHVIDKVVLPKQPDNIVSKALNTPELSSLVTALQAADGDLVNILSGAGPFTVLAPTNDAFAAFLADNNFASLADVPTDVLSQVLLNHVIDGKVMSTDLITAGSGYASTNATGAGDNNMSVFYNTSSGVQFNGISTVSTADVEVTNGVIHIVDKVIGLPTVVDHALANPSFSNLVAALGAADGDLVTVLSGAGPFTVLAPDDAAFTTFLDGTPLANVPTDALSNILLNHVLSGVTMSTDLTTAVAGYTNTNAIGPGMSNLSLYYNTDNGVVFNGISTVAKADVVASNGIIHAVDAVIDIPTVVTFATADPNFSTLVSALTTLTPATDFPAVLSRTEGMNGDGFNPNFTVFAPTNAAFDALASIPEEAILTQVLLHHVIGDNNVRSADLTADGDTVAASLQGDNITVTLPGSGNNIADITDGAGNSDVGIIAVDVQAGNGVIHVVNKVLLPSN
ncbi:fasciclin domain-containing protein [Hwangdonia lutea]|uniref:Fasciclin domain-containing protein n=1 Tax=Hwangdonia lutea TaxID=3075823 RepID=A0AA97EMF8_9FLAO|nr:fasciclin domain-containing protein [Hwangdonia sp. SCSIO 19198]WOD44007.1 fasciclin domain-containing protein [Hwangdonia sp. SCSIO 19198]